MPNTGPHPDIVARSLSDPHIFEQLVIALGPRVHAYLARRTPQHADDLLSEVWLGAFRSRGNYDAAQGSVAAWVFGIARNVLLGHLRASRRDGTRGRYADTPVDEWDAVDQRLDAAGAGSALRQALAALPTEEREVLLLVAWEQLTPSEAAGVLGIPAGTARSRLHRARSRITSSWTNATIPTARGGQS